MTTISLVLFLLKGCRSVQGSFQFGLPLRELQLWLNLQNTTWGQLCTLLKNRNIGLICLKMSVVAVGILVCVSVKYLRIQINIHEMPAV